MQFPADLVTFTLRNPRWKTWSHLRKKSLMENFIFCAVNETSQHSLH